MTTTQTRSDSYWREIYRRHGYFFKEAAMLTISLGVVIHVLRVIFGDDFAMQYVVTPTTDKILLVPMTYAGITGIVLLVTQSRAVRQQATPGARSRAPSSTSQAACRCTSTAATSSGTPL